MTELLMTTDIVVAIILIGVVAVLTLLDDNE